MALFNPADRRLVAVLSQLINCNPFLPRWTELEHGAGDAHQRLAAMRQAVNWSLNLPHPNEVAINRRVEQLAERTRQQLADGEKAADKDLLSYENLALFCLYLRTMRAIWTS